MAQLIPFPRHRRIEPPGTPLTPQRLEELRAEDRRRMLENAVALVFMVAFLMLGYWVVDRVLTYSQNVTCLHARHKSCR